MATSGRQEKRDAPHPGSPNGAALRELIERWRGHAAFDDEFERRMREVRSITSPEFDREEYGGPDTD